MNRTYKLLTFLTLIVLAGVLSFSCKKTDENLNREIPGLGGDSWSNTALDNWINENFTVPFNFSVKYKWDRFEVEATKTMVPPREDKVMPVLQLIKDIWIGPYLDVADLTFFNTYSPKQFVLVGSYEYNSNGTVTEGTAEGGRKITLFNLNTFTRTNKPVVTRMIHVIQHEFGHILHQNKMYPPEFKRVTPGDYTSDWNNQSSGYREKGIITQYAQSNPDDDFVEMIAVMLTEGKASFDAIVAGLPADAQTKLRKKENFIVEYFMRSWNIDFRLLQSKMTEAFQAYFNQVSVEEAMAAKVFSYLTVSPTQAGQSTGFATAMTTAAAALKAYNPTVNYSIARLEYTFPGKDSLEMNVFFASQAAPTNLLQAIYAYHIQQNGDGEITMIYKGPPPVNTAPYNNARGLATQFAALHGFFGANTFRFTYAPGTGFSNPVLLGGFYDAADATNFVKGNFK